MKRHSVTTDLGSGVRHSAGLSGYWGIRIRGDWGTEAIVGDVAYTDDLISMEANPGNLQKKADMVCAWVSFFIVEESEEQARI